MQLSFSFPTNIDIYDVRNFIVYEGNRDIFDFVTSSLFLNNNIYLLTGVKGSGKTYICNIWHKFKNATFINQDIFKLSKNSYISKLHTTIENNHKYILENLESLKIKEEYLLYLINIITEKNSILLITSTKYLNEFDFKLPDLNSRFNNIFNFSIKELNEESREKILVKALSDRQMNIDANTIEYISKRLTGNCHEIINLVDNLEKLIQTKSLKKITVYNIKNILK